MPVFAQALFDLGLLEKAHILFRLKRAARAAIPGSHAVRKKISRSVDLLSISKAAERLRSVSTSGSRPHVPLTIHCELPRIRKMVSLRAGAPRTGLVCYPAGPVVR